MSKYIIKVGDEPLKQISEKPGQTTVMEFDSMVEAAEYAENVEIRDYDIENVSNNS